MERFRVNVDLVPVKAHYFFLNGGMSPVTPFLPIIGRQLGISSSMVGWIYFALPFAGLISRSGIGFLADRLHMRKRMLFLSLLAMAAAFFAVQYSPSLEDEQQVGFALTCDSNSSGTLNYDRRFSCPCTWEAMNFVEDDSNATCALTCPDSDPQPITIKHDGLNFTISKEYNNDCPTGSILKRLSIPFEFIGTSTCVDFDQCHVKCGEDFALKDCLTTGPDSYLKSPGYWSFFTFMIFVWSSMAVSVSLSDTLCFMVLGPSAGDYGKQRLFGSIGWGAVVLFAGYLVDLNNPTKNPIKDYSICHKLGFGFLLVDALSVLFIRLPRRESPKNGAEEEKEEEEGTHMTRTEARKLEMKSFLVPAVAVFLVIVVLEGMCMALVWNYFFWYLDDLSGAWGVTNPKLLQGSVSFIQCFVGELPFFFLSGRVINRIGHQGALTLVMMAFGVRFLLYSLLVNPWVALAIEVSQGLTFSIFYATMASYVHKIYPHEIAATMQGFVGGMNEIGVALGSLIGGYTVEGSSPRYTFRAFGIAALSVGILHFVLRLTVKSIDKFQGFVEKPVDDGDGEDSNNSA